jgi:energy-coupling factor transporter ATP-binding protein EcfA2
MRPAIAVTGLTRRYRDQVALDDVSLTVGAGSITGLLGRNGAGKTTLLRILAGQDFASAGEVRVLGVPPAENEDVLRRMVLIREDLSYPDIKVRHALRAASWFYPVRCGSGGGSARRRPWSWSGRCPMPTSSGPGRLAWTWHRCPCSRSWCTRPAGRIAECPHPPPPSTPLP